VLPIKSSKCSTDNNFVDFVDENEKIQTALENTTHVVMGYMQESTIMSHQPKHTSCD